MAAVTATSATVAAAGTKPPETFEDFDECEQFRLGSSNDAVKDYEKTVLAVTTLTSVMNLQERALKYYNGKARENGALQHLKDYGEVQLIERLDECVKGLLPRHETALKDAAQLVKVINMAIDVCPQPPIQGSEDREGLQTEIDKLNNKHLKSHADVFGIFSSALADTCYYYLTARNQTTNWQYMTWKVTSYSYVFQQYSDYRMREELMKRAISDGVGGVGSDGRKLRPATRLPHSALTSTTAATTDPKQPSSSSATATADNSKLADSVAPGSSTPSNAKPATPSTPSAASASPTSSEPPTSSQSAALSSLSAMFGSEAPPK